MSMVSNDTHTREIAIVNLPRELFQALAIFISSFTHTTRNSL